jgi:hypothetical protein
MTADKNSMKQTLYVKSYDDQFGAGEKIRKRRRRNVFNEAWQSVPRCSLLSREAKRLDSFSLTWSEMGMPS